MVLKLILCLNTNGKATPERRLKALYNPYYGYYMYDFCETICKSNRISIIFTTIMKAQEEKAIEIKFGQGIIEYKYWIFANIEKDGSHSIYIPKFDIFFTANNQEDAISQSKRLMNSFCNYWIKHKGWTEFINHLEKIGFKANSDAQRKALSRQSKKIRKSKMRLSVTSEAAGYKRAYSIDSNTIIKAA